ncbi:uncharacterized protein LY89DRAFT_731632 [Mollisia scopiformis]|uniref:Uncharacterized protein n=1 Tax=Mollisia scopiformis TaxID=149040 RepID=A0A194XGF7_MOLSC|nr:uncharacterized protein LY89DRAFT_731632 [Mollisia scopiformis]KUJ19219.1 hypothetical protein LY89DRAFT_731632 [Mollisia scopiformis]
MIFHYLRSMSQDSAYFHLQQKKHHLKTIISVQLAECPSLVSIYSTNTENDMSDLTNANSPSVNIIPKDSHFEKTSTVTGSPVIGHSFRFPRGDSYVQLTAAVMPSKVSSGKTTVIDTSAMHTPSPNTLNSRQGGPNEIMTRFFDDNESRDFSGRDLDKQVIAGVN